MRARHAMLHHILCGLQQGKHILPQWRKSWRETGGHRPPVGRYVIAIGLFQLSIVKEELAGVARGYHLVGRVKGCRTRRVVQQVETKVVLHIRQTQQA